MELFVPVSNYAVDNYVSTFTWSLTDAPTEGEKRKIKSMTSGSGADSRPTPEICYAYVSALIHQLEAVFLEVMETFLCLFKDLSTNE